MLQMFRFSRLLFWLGGAGILILAALAVIFYVMPPLRDTGDIVYLQADETPFKVRPSEEGGQKIAHQNSRFMSYLDKGEAETEEKEILHLDEDLPEPPPVPIEAEKPSDTAPAQAGGQGLAAADTENPEKQSVMATPLGQAQTDTPPVTADKPDSTDNTSAANGQAEDKTSPAVPVKRPVELANIRKKNNNQAKPDASWQQIQIAAFQDQDKADTAAALLSQKHKARLNGYILSTTIIQKADGGQFWRVMSEAMPAAEANAICDALKKAGQDCFLRKIQEGQ
jgi:hypothetical protein